MKLVITVDGQVEYQRQKGAIKKELTGRIKELGPGKLTVTTLGFSTTFAINRLPVEQNGTRTMTVDGLELTAAGKAAPGAK